MVGMPTKPSVEQNFEVDLHLHAINIEEMSIEAIRQLIEEIEAKIAKRSNRPH